MSGNLAPQEPRSGLPSLTPEAPVVDPRALRTWRLPLTALTVITEPGEATPASPMVLLSTALLRKLLATARAIGPRRRELEAEKPEHIDIKV
jgi:hypothetical protein